MSYYLSGIRPAVYTGMSAGIAVATYTKRVSRTDLPVALALGAATAGIVTFSLVVIQAIVKVVIQTIAKAVKVAYTWLRKESEPDRPSRSKEAEMAEKGMKGAVKDGGLVPTSLPPKPQTSNYTPQLNVETDPKALEAEMLKIYESCLTTYFKEFASAEEREKERPSRNQAVANIWGPLQIILPPEKDLRAVKMLNRRTLGYQDVVRNYPDNVDNDDYRKLIKSQCDLLNKVGVKFFEKALKEKALKEKDEKRTRELFWVASQWFQVPAQLRSIEDISTLVYWGKSIVNGSSYLNKKPKEELLKWLVQVKVGDSKWGEKWNLLEGLFYLETDPPDLSTARQKLGAATKMKNKIAQALIKKLPKDQTTKA